MPSYDIVNGQPVGAPPSVQKSWNEFQGSKAQNPKPYLQQANANPGKWKREAAKNSFKG